MSGRAPIAPKAHGAWLGAGTGGGAAAVTVALIQQYVTHQPLPEAGIQAIYWLVPVIGALIGAYIMPHQARPTDPGVAEIMDGLAVTLAQNMADRQGVRPGRSVPGPPNLAAGQERKEPPA